MGALDRAISVMGGIAALADALGIGESTPSMWKRRKNVPADYCIAIYQVTKALGQPVRPEELRPDIAWDVLREQAAA